MNKTIENKSKIVSFIKCNGYGKNADFVQLLNLKPTRVKELIYQLIDEGIIRQQGNNRNRIYILNDMRSEQ